MCVCGLWLGARRCGLGFGGWYDASCDHVLVKSSAHIISGSSCFLLHVMQSAKSPCTSTCTSTHNCSDHVHAGRAYASVLDKLLKGTSSPSAAGSFASAVQHAESLEHFHIFQRSQGAPWNQVRTASLLYHFQCWCVLYRSCIFSNAATEPLDLQA